VLGHLAAVDYGVDGQPDLVLAPEGMTGAAVTKP
jgi:hypothetical protein